ncbi:hypothetical protein [Paraburkholderia domus]|uniref:hypothetical protein n=1 Tax=Paraburkholderia domus TaxID=2793075 RepID=UPI001B8B36E3|nr:hypothetical protein [Paraburkholderia domus]
MNDEASPLTADAADEVFEVDDLIREAMDADDVSAWEEGLDDPAVLAQRLDTLKGIVWDQEARIRRLQASLDETHAMDTERGMLTQRIQSLERNFESFRKVLTDKEKRAEQALARDPSTRAQHMNAWRYRSITKAREETVEAMLEGGEKFAGMGHIHISEYGDNSLDYPPFAQAIERPDFIVLDALPDVLRQAFMEQFAPVASLIREDAMPHLSLARFEDWQAFAKTFA